ncbi:MAG: helix-hairpin-helix domain-containing protein [Saprospiraceae bacterium]|nr:helix-hairpin-helix domain-containing protein [Saprospiraceae bacterium]
MRTTYSLQEYFYYTRLERNAGIVLCCLCAAVWLFPLAYPQLVSPPPNIEFNEAKVVAVSFSPLDEKEESSSYQPLAFRGRENQSPRKVVLFAFDPNTATKSDFEQLGLSARTAQTILNYRAKGGHFYKKEDFKRIYSIRQEDYARLEAYIQIPPKPFKNKYDDASKGADNQGVATRAAYEDRSFAPQNFTKKTASTMVDINSASAEDWQQIRGIGPGWAKRIVNFREKLGGFNSTAQVAETFGLPDSVFQKALPQMQVSAGLFRKIRLNSATLDELKAHPYLNSYQATILFNFRQQHGNFADMASVKKIKGGFKEEDWKKLEPYFSFE